MVSFEAWMDCGARSPGVLLTPIRKAETSAEYDVVPRLGNNIEPPNGLRAFGLYDWKLEVLLVLGLRSVLI